MAIKPTDSGKRVRFVPLRETGVLIAVTAEYAFVALDGKAGGLVGGTWDQVVVLEEQRPYVPPATRKFKEKHIRREVTEPWFLYALTRGRCFQCGQKTLVVTSEEDAHCTLCGAKFWVKHPNVVVASYALH